MNEKDLAYLRNINTMPGPNAGHSIDPSKPGPDDDLTQSDAEPIASETEQLKAELHNTWQRLETALASEEGWKKRCQFVEAERDEARASRSDVSAGLIEAAEFLEGLADETGKPHTTDSNGEPLISRAHRCNGYRQSAEALRARAATDRSGK